MKKDIIIRGGGIHGLKEGDTIKDIDAGFAGGDKFRDDDWG